MWPNLTVIVKVAERCNLGCPYCYMYEGADQQWRTRPRFLSDELTDLLVARIADYLHLSPGVGVTIELHGGEPLLWGKQRVRRLAREAARLDAQRVDVTVQTNGTLIDDEWLDLFADERVTFAISCDGPPAVQDRTRPGLDGRPTGAVVERAIVSALAHPRARRLFGGVLAVAELRHDPAEVIRYFHRLGVADVDLLLPDMPRRQALQHAQAASRYLNAAFDEWIAIDDARFSVRFLAEFTLGVLGIPSELDYLGGDLSGIVVVESDGSLQLLDVLRVCAADAASTGMSIQTHALHEAVNASTAFNVAPAAACRGCRAFTACGGGYLPHRYDDGSFDNPSGYCAALLGLFDHAAGRLRRVTPPHAWREAAVRSGDSA